MKRPPARVGGRFNCMNLNYPIKKFPWQKYGERRKAIFAADRKSALLLPQGRGSRDESDLDGDLRGRQAPALRVRRMRKYYPHL